jgi:hypothetical protein
MIRSMKGLPDAIDLCFGLGLGSPGVRERK